MYYQDGNVFCKRMICDFTCSLAFSPLPSPSPSFVSFLSIFFLTVAILFIPGFVFGKGEGKGHPGKGHEGQEGEWGYGSTLSLTSALDGVGGQRHAPSAVLSGIIIITTTTTTTTNCN